MSFNINEDKSIRLTYSMFIKHLYKKKQEARQFRDGNFSVKYGKEFGNLVIIDDISITFDSWNPHADVIFISHAHSDHIPIIPKTHIEDLYKGSKKTFFICSKITKEVAEVRTKGQFKFPEDNWLLGKSSKYPQFTHYKGAKFSLIKNGHAYGSTSLIIEGSEKILYTGDFITEDRVFSGNKTSLFGLKPIKCDRLMMECTYGLPEYVFPTFKEIKNNLNEYIQNQLDFQYPIILLGYAYGKSQVILNMLDDSYTIFLHEAIAQITEILELNGIKFTEWEMIKNNHRKISKNLGNSLLIIPLNLINSEPYESLISQGAKFIALSGKILNGSYRKEFKVDKYLPLSDHCDFKNLFKFIKKCQVRTIYIEHGKIEEFSYYLLRKFGNMNILNLEDSYSSFVL